MLGVALRTECWSTSPRLGLQQQIFTPGLQGGWLAVVCGSAPGDGQLHTLLVLDDGSAWRALPFREPAEEADTPGDVLHSWQRTGRRGLGGASGAARRTPSSPQGARARLSQVQSQGAGNVLCLQGSVVKGEEMNDNNCEQVIRPTTHDRCYQIQGLHLHLLIVLCVETGSTSVSHMSSVTRVP